MNPTQIGIGRANENLWIECPDCDGCGGWYGCDNCGAVLTREAPPEERYCAPCKRAMACVESGGHTWGRLHREGQRWVLVCTRDCGVTRKVEASWQRHGDSYAHVATYLGTTYAAASTR